MRSNRLKILLIPILCLSFISCNKVNETNLYDENIQEQYKLFLKTNSGTNYEASLKSVVSVYTFKGGDANSIGSGFIFEQDDKYQYIITNHHVVEEADSFKLISCTGQVKNATLLGVDEIFDIAVLKCEIFADTQVAKFPNEDYKLIENPLVGSEVYAIGNPGSLDNYGTITFGIVSKVDADPFAASSSFENADYAIQIDCALNSGNSGGPLFNENGEVIGINTFALSRLNGIVYEGINYSLPIQDALHIANNIKESGDFIRPTIGYNKYINTSSLTIYEKEYLKLDRSFTQGVLVKEFATNNILDIPKYSIITKINDIEINSIAEFRRQLYFAGPNEKVKISYYEHKENGYDFVEKDINVTTKSAVI